MTSVTERLRALLDERVGEFVCSECGETFGDVRDQQPNYCPNCGRRCVG